MRVKVIIVKYAKRLVSMVGGVLISKVEYSQSQLQLASAIHRLIKKGCKSQYVDGLSCVVFSKDRAIQLYALIETYQKFVKNPAPMYIIYNTSTHDHELSYIELLNIVGGSKNIKFIKEKESFRKTLLFVLSTIKTKNFFFLTDDNIFIRNFDIDFSSKINPLKKILSLRHNPNICYSYTARKHFTPPDFVPCQENKLLLEFNWFDKDYEWSDPWSVDGHIFLTEEVLVLSKISNYKLPNSYESALKSFNFLICGRKGVCHTKSVIMNIPMNIVQSECSNVSGTTSASYLLKKWNDGLALDVSFLENYHILSTHDDQAIDFKKRNINHFE